MANAGRIICVSLPFILILVSIVLMLIAGLTGVTSNNSLYMFRVNLTDLSISPASVANLLKISTRSASPVDWHDLTLLQSDSTTSADQTSNITAADLGLASVYDINLWGYCYTDAKGDRNCTKAEFDWASTYLNTSELTSLTAASGTNITLPTEITDALKAFKTVTKWTEVVYIIAMIALGVELFFGLFTSCSRAISCLTWVISGVATVAAIGAASLMTAMSSIVVGAVESTAKFYGVKGSVNTSFLAVIWLGVAFAIAAGLFWMFTICCCKPDRSRSAKRNLDDQEKFIPTGSYAPLNDRNSYGYNNQYGQSQYGAPRHQQAERNMAYEPYSHNNV